MTKKTQRKNPLAIKKMHEIEYTGYVYDLTTKNHHFAAGIGNIIVHNTDSVFYTFNLSDLNGKPIRGKDALEMILAGASGVSIGTASFGNPTAIMKIQSELKQLLIDRGFTSLKQAVGFAHRPNEGE